ncbi:MAG: RDD family protein [Planctomycetota bacterium]|jgi:uncharacterized RDD family membrane protein YckC
MEDFDVIETPENVNLHRRLAGIGSRLLAGLLDTLLIAGLYVVLLIVLIVVGLDPLGVRPDLADTLGMVLFAVLILCAFLIYWGYFILFETWLNGQTPGKRRMKIRVVQQEGAAVTLNAVVVRNLLRAVDFIGLYAVAGVSMFVTRKNQRLGDLAAGTVVVSEEIQDYAARSDKKQRLLDNVALPAAHLASTGLRPEEYRLLHNYWLRRHELTVEARRRVLPGLVQPILNRMETSLRDQSLVTLEEYVDDLMRRARGADPSITWPGPPPEEQT